MWMQGPQRIGAVNTVVNQNGLLIGYNTDYDGFSYLLNRHGFSLTGKIVFILGSGGTAKTVAAVARDRQAKEIVLVSRGNKAGTIPYAEAQARADAEIVVNASPQGMYPQNGAPLLDLAGFAHCQAVIDVIYNPLKTKLLLTAEALGIPCANGLEMLVAQAGYAAAYFSGQAVDLGKIAAVWADLRQKLTNAVLIAMPSAGKTSLGQALAEMLGKRFVDLDSLIEQEAQMSVPQIFARHGEACFRDWESEIAARVGLETGQVIATGGGIVKRAANIAALKQNGALLFIDRDLELLLPGYGRPLSQDRAALAALYAERLPLYQKYSDATVANNGAQHAAAQALRTTFEELMRR